MKKIKIFLFFIFITISSFCQTKSIKTLKEVDNLLNKYQQEHKLDSLAELAYKTSVKYYRKNDFKKAIKYSSLEIEARRKLVDTLRYKKSVFNKALFLYKDKQYFKSLNTYQIVIDSFDIDKRTYRTYCKIGDIYARLGDYYQAENYYKKGLSKSDVFSDKELFGHYINYSIIYDKIDTPLSLKKEILLLQKAEKINSFKLSDNNYYSLNFALANYYKNDLSFDLTKSKKHYLKVLNRANNNKDTITALKVYINLSSLLNKTKNDSALFYINKGLSVSKNNSYTSNLYYRLAENNFNKKQFNNSLKYLNKALNKVLKNNSIFDLNINDLPNKVKLFYIIKQKALIYLKLFKYKSNIEDLEFSLKNFSIADQLLNFIKKENIEKQSKLFWQKEASEVYFNAVKVCQLLNKYEDAFYFMEKNKALLLLENISESEIKKQANIPIKILEQELELKQKINHLENLINKDNFNNDSIKNEYYATKIELGNFIQSLKATYPEYHDYKKPIEIITLNEVQKNLDNHTMALEYILNDKGGYILTITKNATKLHEIDSIGKINSTIESYISSISKPINTKSDAANYKMVAHQLYQSLLPISKDSLKNITKLIVIPDYTIQNITFEALLTTNNNSSSYLINDYEISYAYSLSFLQQNNQNKTRKKPFNQFIGIAPYNFSYDNLSSLGNNTKEVLDVKLKYNGLVLLDTLATKENFTSNIEKYKIIHLATHANANDSIAPWIAFYDDKMYLNEINSTKNNAELVVLSACKTSLGEINPGEGVFSLARGFFYGGSKSVISSLWNVNDKSNQEIINDFYVNLKKGETKSVALRNAKLKYINSHQLSEKSPYYWASMILIGDANTITSITIYPYLLIIFLIILTFFLYRKIKK